MDAVQNERRIVEKRRQLSREDKKQIAHALARLLEQQQPGETPTTATAVTGA